LLRLVLCYETFIGRNDESKVKQFRNSFGPVWAFHD